MCGIGLHLVEAQRLEPEPFPHGRGRAQLVTTVADVAGGPVWIDQRLACGLGQNRQAPSRRSLGRQRNCVVQARSRWRSPMKHRSQSRQAVIRAAFSSNRKLRTGNRCCGDPAPGILAQPGQDDFDHRGESSKRSSFQMRGSALQLQHRAFRRVRRRQVKLASRAGSAGRLCSRSRWAMNYSASGARRAGGK